MNFGSNVATRFSRPDVGNNGLHIGSVREPCVAPPALGMRLQLPTAMPWATLWSRLSGARCMVVHSSLSQPVLLPWFGLLADLFVWSELPIHSFIMMNN